MRIEKKGIIACLQSGLHFIFFFLNNNFNASFFTNYKDLQGFRKIKKLNLFEIVCGWLK